MNNVLKAEYNILLHCTHQMMILFPWLCLPLDLSETEILQNKGWHFFLKERSFTELYAVAQLNKP